MPSVFPSSFIFCTVLLCSLSILFFFFLHSISVTGTTSLFVNQNLADYDNPLILQALIANPSVFLYLSTELIGSCLQL